MSRFTDLLIESTEATGEGMFDELGVLSPFPCKSGEAGLSRKGQVILLSRQSLLGAYSERGAYEKQLPDDRSDFVGYPGPGQPS